MVNKGCQR